MIRGGDLYKHMSTYLARRIEQTPNIEVLLNTTIERMAGDGTSLRSRSSNDRTGESAHDRDAGALQLHRRGRRGPTGCPRRSRATRAASSGPALRSRSLSDGMSRREPFLLETSRPGVFAAGDVRASSVKRVASAVGEGSMAVQFVHEYLKEM